MATEHIGLNLVEATEADLQRLLSEGKLSNVDLATKCLQQIEKYDRQEPNSHAMIAVAPRPYILERAKYLNDERGAGRLLGPLHGIPILLNIRSL
jgi:amidase